MISIQLRTTGEDDLAKFHLNLPGYCKKCNQGVEVSIEYDGPYARMLRTALEGRGIDFEKTHSLAVKVNNKVSEIGVTCGCYARFQRQVAHISDTRSARKKG